jgi:hypothetical protein
MKLSAALLFALSLAGQAPPTLTVTVSHQPYEVFKAAFGGGLRGVGLYQATVCNKTDGGMRISEGVIVQAIEKKVGTVNPALAISTANRARTKGKKYRIAKAAEYALLGGSLFTAGGTIAASNGVKLGLVAAQGFAGKFSEDARAEAGLDISALAQFLDPGRTTVLDARSCSSRLALGAFKKTFDPFEVQIP